MNLVVEIGNTNAKFALFDGEEFINKFIFPKNEIDLNVLQSFQIERAILSGSGSIDKGIWAEIDAEEKLLFSPSLLSSISSLYHSSTLGWDRWVNAAYAAKLFSHKPNLIIDIGTCLTFTFINENNELIGGSISPGIRLRSQSLNQYTAHLPLINDFEVDPPLIGYDTKTSIQSGILKGIIYEIMGRIAEYLKKYPNLNLIMTGGDAEFVHNKLNYKIFADAHFTLRGLNDILIRNV